jgi:hypothetical protein
MRIKKDTETIKLNYVRACNDYLYKLLDMWTIHWNDPDDGFGWWVGDEVGGIFCLEDDTFISMDDIRYCVDNEVSYDDYSDYLDYNVKCSDNGFDGMNLKAFIKGAPRVNDEVFEKIGTMKENLKKIIDAEKERLGQY